MGPNNQQSQPNTPNAQASGSAGNAAQNQPQPNAARNPNSTQNTLLIAEIRDSMAIMTDGSFRGILACKSINFDLMSNREREGVEFSYQSFLNSLYFPLQIVIRSQRVDIGPYIDRLSKLRRSQDNMLLGVLMDDYIDFVAQLSEESNIMDKGFFIIVPYYPAGDIGSAVNSSKNLLANLFATQQKGTIKVDTTTYEKALDEIDNRLEVVSSGLFQMGVQSSRLDTKQIGELFYNAYNPDTAVREPIGNFQNMTSTYVQKGQGQAARPYINREDM